MQAEGRMWLQGSERETETGGYFHLRPEIVVSARGQSEPDLDWAGLGDNEREGSEANNSPAAGQLTRPLSPTKL